MDIAELIAREEIKQLRLGYATHFDRQDIGALMELLPKTPSANSVKSSAETG